MIDYNDGNWHGWNGADCPVHPNSVVEAVWHDPRQNSAGMTGPRQAKVENYVTLAWGQVVKFRVVTPYTEPREGWVVQVFDSARQAKTARPGCEPVFMREVRE